jgi:tRNA A37 methylthiotransferase MiaB
MKKIFTYVDACERRNLDANKICTYLSKNNYRIVDKPEDADIIIFITCAVFDEVTESSLQKVKEFQKYDADLVVAGCLPEIEKEKLSEIFNGKTISTKDLDEIDDLFPENKIKFGYIDDANILFQDLDGYRPIGVIKKICRNVRWIENIYVKVKDHVLKNLFGEHSTIYAIFSKNSFYRIRASWGCLGNCSYCVIKKAIGPFHSKSLDQCMREFRRGLNEGYKHFVITADDAGSYGLDIGSSFPELLDKMTETPGEYEISIRGLHPRWVIKYIDDLEDILKRGKLTSVDIPIQSGSTRILKLMHRFSDVEKMKDAFIRLKKSSPDVLLNTHVIVGFPTETEGDFKQTLSFIKKISFNEVYTFPFSCKIGSEAENIESKVSLEEMSKRVRYAKRFLKKAGYHVINTPRSRSVLFEKRNYHIKSREVLYNENL